MRNSSSNDAWADTKKRSAAGPPAAVSRSATFASAVLQSVGSSVPVSVRRSGRCSRSSPTADAAASPSFTSPGSRIPIAAVSWPQTPAKQSACNSIETWA